MTVLLIFLAVVVLGVALMFLTPVLHRLRLSKGSTHMPELPDGFEEPVPTLPAVLLPESPRAADIDRLRFSLGLRGYRMDQVDEVLDRVRDQLAVQDAEITRLKHVLQAAGIRDASEPSGVLAAQELASEEPAGQTLSATPDTDA